MLILRSILFAGIMTRGLITEAWNRQQCSEKENYYPHPNTFINHVI